METPATALLEVRGLTVERPGTLDDRDIGLRNVSIEVNAGEIFVFAGEKGCGKSLLAQFIAGAAGPRMRVLSGSICFEGREILGLNPRELRQLRTGGVTLISGDDNGQFNPDRTVRQWLQDCARMSGVKSGRGDGKTGSEYFYTVGIIEPERILPVPMGELPTMVVKRLQVMKAVIAGSRLLVCDGATRGLDRIAEAQLIELLSQVRDEFGMSILITAGSLRGVERYADRVAVFFEGGILESGSTREILENPRYAYTAEFRACEPRLTDYPRELPTISREAAREAEDAIHQSVSSLDEAETG